MLNNHFFQYSATAFGQLPELVGGQDLRELMVNTLIDKYFQSRSKLNAEEILLLLNNTTNIGMLNDELQRLKALQNAQVIDISNDYTIDYYDFFDYKGEAMVTETVIYSYSDFSETKTIIHNLSFSYVDETYTSLILTSDEYIEPEILFVSCSYLPEYEMIVPYENSTATNDHINTGDYAYDLAMVAETQVGYLEKATNSDLDSKTGNAGTGDYTKYGRDLNQNGKMWCVVFAVWCAREADISIATDTPVIMNTPSTGAMRRHFKDQGRYYDSVSRGGTYVPKIGDIYFEEAHTAIVVAVTNTYVTIIEGNAGKTNPKVQKRNVKLTSSSIYGYGNPAYTTLQSAHDYVNTNHTLGMAHTCSQCGKAENAIWSSTHGSNMTHECSLCDYTVNASWVGNHTTSAMMHTCSICGVTDWAAWDSDHLGIAPIHECTLCSYTTSPASWICDHSVSMIHTCSFCNYSKQGSWYGDHAREDNHFCSVCDYENEEMHVNDSLVHNRLKHWRECASCDDVWDEENHSWVEISGGRLQCTVCNYILTDIIINQEPTQNQTE